jgi:hypothetical protein
MGSVEEKVHSNSLRRRQERKLLRERSGKARRSICPSVGEGERGKGGEA